MLGHWWELLLKSDPKLFKSPFFSTAKFSFFVKLLISLVLLQLFSSKTVNVVKNICLFSSCGGQNNKCSKNENVSWTCHKSCEKDKMIVEHSNQLVHSNGHIWKVIISKKTLFKLSSLHSISHAQTS